MKLLPKAASLRVAAAQKAVRAAQRTANKCSFVSADDPQGSYTGTPQDGGMPVQDADDL